MTPLSALSAPLSAPCTTRPPNTPRGAAQQVPPPLRGIGGQQHEHRVDSPIRPRRPAAGNQEYDSCARSPSMHAVTSVEACHLLPH